MFQTLKNAWKIPELKRKMLITLLIIVLYRLGANIFVPYVDQHLIKGFTQQTEGSIFQFLNMLSGDAFSKGTFFALAVSPYITASIVMQLLTIAIPALERLSKKGEEGKKKIAGYTRIVTIVLALVTAFGYTHILCQNKFLTFSTKAMAKTDSTLTNVIPNGQAAFKYIVMIACFCAGAALIMWLAEKINEHGIGNGISMILFANIVAGFPGYVSLIINMVKNQKYLAVGIVFAVLILLVLIAVTVFVVWFTNSERRIPVQYAKRVVGRKMYGGQSSNLPLKMNMAGVMPIIFASSIVSLPETIAMFTGTGKFSKFVSTYLGHTSWIYVALFIVLIVAFSYFYIMISFNPVEVANNIRNNGGAVPGIRPGKPTSDYIKKILNKITLIGAVFLAALAGLPMIINIIGGGNTAVLAFSGSSLLIVIGVILETIHDIEAQMTMRNYKGFLD